MLIQITSNTLSVQPKHLIQSKYKKDIHPILSLICSQRRKAQEDFVWNAAKRGGNKTFINAMLDKGKSATGYKRTLLIQPHLVHYIFYFPKCNTGKRSHNVQCKNNNMTVRWKIAIPTIGNNFFCAKS